MKCLKFICLIILLISCNSNKKINVHNNSFLSGIGIYFLNADNISKEDCEKLVKDKFPEFKQIEKIPEKIDFDAYTIKIFNNPEPDYTPPDTNALKVFGKDLTSDEVLNLQNYKGVISIVFCGTPKDIYTKQKRISEFVKNLTENKEVIINDYNTNEWFNVKSWKIYRIDNFNDPIKDIAHQITIHIYRTGEYCRAVSMGMGKFCLPDISIKDFSCSNQSIYGNLIISVVQTLAENPYILNDSTLFIDLKKIKNDNVRNSLRTILMKNAKETCLIKLKTVEPEKGDDFNNQFIIAFENKEYSSPQEEQERLVEDLFGVEDKIVSVKHDSLLLHTSEKAKQRLPELKKMFNNGLAPGYSILVKAPFKTNNNGTEWMWVEITKWTSKSITGILQNDPDNIENLKSGAIVNVNEKDLFDYILYKPDGSYEGNETGKILEQME